MADETPKRLSDVDRLNRLERVEAHEENKPKPSGEGSFQSYMDETQNPQNAQKASTEKTPMELASQNRTPSEPPTIHSVNAQMQSASSTLGDIQKQLNTKGLKLKQSQNYLLRNKLKSANGNLRAASKKVGSDPGPAPKTSSRNSPVEKFLNLVTDGQRQMQAATKQVDEISKKGTDMNPGDLLVVQLKLQKAQQELEYSSVVLTKAIDDMKLLFNVQI